MKKRTTKKAKVIVMRIAMLAIMIGVAYGGAAAIGTFAANQILEHQYDRTYKQVVVCEGDTLWSIAEDNTESKDLRDVVYEIREVNDLDGANINPGDVIFVPQD